MNRMAFFRSLVVGMVVMIGLVSVSSGANAQSNPCTAPAACMDTTDWSGSQVSANCTLPLLQCPGMQDGVYCCRQLPQNEVPADPQSNVQGAAAAQTGAAITSGSGSCSYNGVKDPFCGKSVAEIIGKAIQFLLGAAGALFLAMFVYGGATWLTAGSSDRHEQAQKTLLNAAAGILVVILSYTMVSLLVRFAEGLGGGQGNSQAVLGNASQEPSAGSDQQTGGGLPSAGPGAALSLTSCNTSRVESTCRGQCTLNVISGGAPTPDYCDYCSPLAIAICAIPRADCSARCSAMCGAIPMSAMNRSECVYTCGEVCTDPYAFRTDPLR